MDIEDERFTADCELALKDFKSKGIAITNIKTAGAIRRYGLLRVGAEVFVNIVDLPLALSVFKCPASMVTKLVRDTPPETNPTGERGLLLREKDALGFNA